MVGASGNRARGASTASAPARRSSRRVGWRAIGVARRNAPSAHSSPSAYGRSVGSQRHVSAWVTNSKVPTIAAVRERVSRFTAYATSVAAPAANSAVASRSTTKRAPTAAKGASVSGPSGVCGKKKSRYGTRPCATSSEASA